MFYKCMNIGASSTEKGTVTKDGPNHSPHLLQSQTHT